MVMLPTEGKSVGVRSLVKALIQKSNTTPIIIEVHIRGEIHHVNIANLEWSTCRGWILHTDEIGG